MTELRTGKRRLYIDETVWIGLACEGELRATLKAALKGLLKRDWLLLSSTHALNALIGLEFDDPPASLSWFHFHQIVRRICAEIVSVEAEDMERSALEVASRQISIHTAVHITMIRKMGCDGVVSLSEELRRAASVEAIDPLKPV